MIELKYDTFSLNWLLSEIQICGFIFVSVNFQFLYLKLAFFLTSWSVSYQVWGGGGLLIWKGCGCSLEILN